MGLESTTTIGGLVSTNPVASDALGQADDHIRLLKTVLKTIFPGAGGSGFTTPITASEAELNYVDGVTSAIQTQLNTHTSNIATAQSTANTGVSNAATADGKAVTAQGTANTALANAATAQGTANTALANAATALADSATALSVANAAAPKTYAPRAWAEFTYSGSVTIVGSINVSGITRVSAGVFEVTFTSALTVNTYAVLVSSRDAGATAPNIVNYYNKSTTKFRISCYNISGTLTDPSGAISFSAMSSS